MPRYAAAARQLTEDASDAAGASGKTRQLCDLTVRRDTTLWNQRDNLPDLLGDARFIRLRALQRFVASQRFVTIIFRASGSVERRA